MSSCDITTSGEKNGTAQQSTAGRLLFILKTRGPQTISALANLAGTGTENIRQQLQKSVTEGLVEPYLTKKSQRLADRCNSGS